MCPGKELATADSLRHGAQVRNVFGRLYGHLCFGTASPRLRQPGCGTRRRAGCLSHRRCQGSGSMPAACEGLKGGFGLGGRPREGLWHQLVLSPCFLRKAWFPHFRHTHPLPKQDTFVQLLKFLWEKPLGSKDLRTRLMGGKAIEH